MPTPPPTNKERKRRKAYIEKLYKEGYAPKGVMGGKGSAVEKAGRDFGLKRGGGLGHWLQAEITARNKGDESFVPDESLYVPLETQITQTEEITVENRLRDRIKDLESALTAIHRDNVDAAKLREFISGIEPLPGPPKWVMSKPKSGGYGTPVTIWSDWHVGEVVAPEQVGGLNEFNIAIARRRAQTLVEKTISLCFDYAKTPEYPGIVVCLGGDMISGLIHLELSETMEGPFTEQVKEAFSLIAAGLTALADRFDKVFVPCVVGNHGRLHHRPRAKNRAQDSFEYLVYHFLEAHFKDDPRVKFMIAEQTDILFTVAGHRFLLTHGDSTGAKGGDGIIGAIGPIVRGEKRVRDVQALTDAPYDTALMGHYHVKVSLDGVIVNPAFKGYDEYARNILRARPETPAQMLFFVHPDYGIIDERRIFLEARRRPSNTEWVSWQQ